MRATDRMGRIAGIVLTALLLLFTVSCGRPEAEAMRELYKNEEKIATPYSSYVMDSGEQEVSGQETSGSFARFNGMVMFWSCYIEQEVAVDVRYDIRVKQGKVKLVLVDPDFQVITIDEITSQTAEDDAQVQTLLLGEGTTFLKLVGTDDAQVEFEVSIREGEFYAVKN